MATKLHPLGAPRAGYVWGANPGHIDMATAPAKPVPLKIAAVPQNVTIDLKRSAMIVIDMQNDFCAKGGWVDYLGADYTPDRKPIKPLQKLLPVLRQAGMPIIWVNWGNRPDLANMPPNQIHLYKPAGTGIGLGDPLPGSGAPVLQKDSWAAAVVDELEQKPEDIKVDKHRISGFWDTPLDSILRNLGIRTALFSGVNTDRTKRWMAVRAVSRPATITPSPAASAGSWMARPPSSAVATSAASVVRPGSRSWARQ